MTGDFVFLLPFSDARFSPSTTRAAQRHVQKQRSATETETENETETAQRAYINDGRRGTGGATEQRTFHVASHKVRTESLYDSALLRAAALLRYLLICIALIEVYYISRHFSASELKESFILERVSTG